VKKKASKKERKMLPFLWFEAKKTTKTENNKRHSLQFLLKADSPFRAT